MEAVSVATVASGDRFSLVIFMKSVFLAVCSLFSHIQQRLPARFLSLPWPASAVLGAQHQWGVGLNLCLHATALPSCRLFHLQLLIIPRLIVGNDTICMI